MPINGEVDSVEPKVPDKEAQRVLLIGSNVYFEDGNALKRSVPQARKPAAEARSSSLKMRMVYVQISGTKNAYYLCLMKRRQNPD